MSMDGTLKDLYLLVNFAAEHQKYDCIILIDQWKPINLTMAKTADAFFVAVQLDNLTWVSIEILKNGLFDYFDACDGLGRVNLKSDMYSSPDVSELASSIRNEVDLLKRQSLAQLADKIRDQIKLIYLNWC